MNYDLIKYYFESGVYNAKKVAEYVKNGTITEEQFHEITSLNFQGIMKRDE